MTTVFCRTSFEDVHLWADAPEPVAFLRHPHRHVFHVRVTVPVHHDDRDVEFITLKHHVDRLIAELQNGDVLRWSCEHWARAILEASGAVEVEVSEDGENGATVTR